MGAVERSGNGQVKNKKKNGVTKNFIGKKYGHRNHPPFLVSNTFPPFSPIMRPRPPFPPGRMPPPGMGPMPPPGVRMPGGPLPLFRTRVPPPRGMGPRGLMPGPPPMPMRPRPLHHMPMRPPPLMRPPPPMMGRFPPRGPPPMLPPNKLRALKNKMGNKRNYKKKNSQGTFDLASPWVSNDLKGEFEKKDKSLAKAKETGKTEDWDVFKEQRSKCDKMYKAAKLEYIGKHPEEVIEDDCSDDIDTGYVYDEVFEYFCDPCERGFSDPIQLEYHYQEHRICGIDGCEFVAHARVVDKHIEMQHISGLYYRIKKTETPEDVAQWIQERKKKYPSKENIEKRQKEQEEMLKRGEKILTPKERFGRNNKRVYQNQRPMWDYPYKHPREYGGKKGKKRRKSPVFYSKNRSNWNGNLPAFHGTSDLYPKAKKSEKDEIDDSEWMSTENKKTKIAMNNALGALIGAYKSSDESEEDKTQTKVSQERVSGATKETEQDGEPDEMAVSRETSSDMNCSTSNPNKKNVRNRKRKQTQGTNDGKQPQKMEEGTEGKVIEKPKKSWREITLLERLLASEIKQERNTILQCIRFVVKNNFFDKNVSVEGASSSHPKMDVDEKIPEDIDASKTLVDDSTPDKI